MPDWAARLWDDTDNRDLIARVFPQYITRYDRIRKGVVKADIARYAMLFAEGGFYCDTDYEWLAPLPEAYLKHECVLPISRGSRPGEIGFRLGNAVMGSAPGYRFWSDLLADIFKSDLDSIAEDHIEATTGPEALTDFFLKTPGSYSDACLPPWPEFHPPVSRRNPFGKYSVDAIGIHHCWGSWRTADVSRSLYNIAYRKLSAI